ncbi:MAG: 50S ribosomal protein L6 [Firmicutes bacterium]|nr:50S ribosomal protein L6 [Bacillota bacterium]MCD7746808.1 50S ribosomal protein L6 [Bacillota bacterium]MCD7787818.1 50S ribosomal protein L6 [Bacillota bacterium]MCD7831572.1 50S ribosomal protein L6 [Bacillota bacterium]MCD8314699.1 50S ribosomal protein L6 [Bacillota bacterium]
MSRIGRKEIVIPAGVEVTVGEGNAVTVKGPKGTLHKTLHPRMTIERDGNVIHVKRPTDEQEDRALHGLTRSLLANMVEGVTHGFEKKLEIVGTGYRAAVSGKTLVLNLGYSHDIKMEPEEGISFETPTPTNIVVRGIDKQRVGEIAAQVRGTRPPEPYHGKGVKYEGEKIRRKSGKAGK